MISLNLVTFDPFEFLFNKNLISSRQVMCYIESGILSDNKVTYHRPTRTSLGVATGEVMCLAMNIFGSMHGINYFHQLLSE